MASLSVTTGALSVEAQTAPATTSASVGGVFIAPDPIGCPWTPLYIPSSTNFRALPQPPHDNPGPFKVWGDRKDETDPLNGAVH
jgi:hypothetical protein